MGLDRSDDRTVWDYASAEGFCIVTLDADFAELSALKGSPPKVVWLRCGNRPTAYVENLIRNHVLPIRTMGLGGDIDCLEVG